MSATICVQKQCFASTPSSSGLEHITHYMESTPSLSQVLVLELEFLINLVQLVRLS